jgi:BirA family biotin operon repressor/biotin-[acetyl-CoA-carboxylase] ligase
MHFALTRLATVTSTMDVCRALAEAGAAEGTTVLADEQTAGRGRAGHGWYSPAGQALYVSVLLRPTLSVRQSPWLTMLAALAVWDTLRWEIRDWERAQSPVSNLQASVLSIKWLNDIHLNRRKVAGILVETTLTGERLDYAVVGMGVNVNTDFAAAPAEVRARATSLQVEFGVDFVRESILQNLLHNFGVRYDELQCTCHSPAEEYAQHLETLGQPVRVQMGAEVVAGVAVRVDAFGALVIATDSGERAVSFGSLL